MSLRTKNLLGACVAVALSVLALGSDDAENGSPTRAQGPASPAAETAPAPATGNWVVEARTDPMNDLTTTQATLKWKVEGWLSQPEIVVRCKENKTDVIYDFQEILTRTEWTGGFQHKAKFRWDDKTAEDRVFEEAEGATTAVFSGTAISDAKKLRAHQRLRVQYTKVLGGEVTDHDVDLAGADAAIAEVARACSW